MQPANENAVQERSAVEAEGDFRIPDARLATFFENAGDGIVFTNIEGKILTINKAGLAILGHEKSEVTGRNGLSFFARRSWPAALRAKKRTSKKGFAKNIRLLLRAKSGAQVPVEVDLKILEGAKGNPIGFAGIIRPVG